MHNSTSNQELNTPLTLGEEQFMYINVAIRIHCSKGKITVLLQLPIYPFKLQEKRIQFVISSKRESTHHKSQKYK